jgi:hypothetical protein
MLPLTGWTDDRFAVVLRDPSAAVAAEEVRQLLHECHALCLEEREEE